MRRLGRSGLRRWAGCIGSTSASAPRTNASAFGGWPTPDASVMNDGERLATFETRRERLKEKHGNGNGAGRPLAIAAQLTGWPTPDAQGHRDGTKMRKITVSSAEHGAYRGVSLHHAAQMTGWPTPMANQKHDTERQRIALLTGHEAPSEQRKWLAGWPTPKTADADKSVRTAAGAAKEAKRRGPANDLATATQLAGWPTPQAEADAKQAVIAPGREPDPCLGGLGNATQPPNGPLHGQPEPGRQTQEPLGGPVLLGGMGHADGPRPQGRGENLGEHADQRSAWEASELVYCADGKARAVGSDSRPLAARLPLSMAYLSPAQRRLAAMAGIDGASLRRAKASRIGSLRALGNAICPQVAAAFIRAYMDCRP